MKFVVLILSSILFYSQAVLAAKTYITTDEVAVFDRINGQQVDEWPARTLFTSSAEDDFWLTISGTFPEGEWEPVSPKLYIENTAALEERNPYQEAGGKTILYQKLQTQSGSKAKAYKLLEFAAVFSQPPVIDDSLQQQPVATWPKDKVFTSVSQTAAYIKATGHFPAETWQPLEQAVYLRKPVKLQDRTKPKPYQRDIKAKRFVVIDKTKFEMTLYEVVNEKKVKLVKTPVALGYDRCLPKEKGGKCYYTPEGIFDIEFKLFDPDGITWCVPPKMEAEFKSKIAKGERCWRGIMGNHALHFGNSLFLHGTSNPSSIGSRTTHGCVRLRNSDIETVYRLLDNGDKVVITSDITKVDLLELAQENVGSETL